MSLKSAFARKIVYLVILVVMLVPLFLLGQPAAGKGDRGGQLAEMRDRFNMAESDLGDISPASETMKLASLGMRGVASTLLWNKAHEYGVRHEWDRLKATLNNIALLQPHFDRVWEFQAWNLAYNVSTEFDDYRQRYAMVKEGTDYLIRGVNQNRNASRLVWYTGWFYGQKMGMADEKKQFREMFADDENAHQKLLEENIAVDDPQALGPLGKPDNWLVGRLWLNRGYDLVDSGVKILRQTPINFYETGPKWRYKHAEAIEKEGILDDRAQNAWELASDDWIRFGERSIPVTAPFTIKLDRADELERLQEEKKEEFDSFAGEYYEVARQGQIDALKPEQRAILLANKEDLTEDEQYEQYMYELRVVPNPQQIARYTKDEDRLRAINLAGEIADLQERIDKTRAYQRQINYEYWKTLAIAEQEERTVRARRSVYEAEKANEDAEPDRAIELYEEAFQLWAEIFDDYPILTIDDTAIDLRESIRRYAVTIDSEDLGDDFPLRTFVDMFDENDKIDPEAYERVRKSQQELLERRKKELEEEEQKKIQEADESASSTSDDGAGSEDQATVGEEAEMESGDKAADADDEQEGSDPDAEATESSNESTSESQEPQQDSDSDSGDESQGEDD